MHNHCSHPHEAQLEERPNTVDMSDEIPKSTTANEALAWLVMAIAAWFMGWLMGLW